MILMPRAKCSKTYIAPNVQYFLASFCDVQWKINDCKAIRAQSPWAVEVKRLLDSLDDEHAVSAQEFPPKTIITVLKEILNEFPGGIFSDIWPEMNLIPLSATPELALTLLQGEIDKLPYLLQLFAGLVFRGIRNLVYRCQPNDVMGTYTDLLIHFTTTLFPQVLGDTESFVKASRLILLMTDCCEFVFQKLSGWNDIDTQELSDASTLEDSEESQYLAEIMTCLTRLEDYLAADPEPQSSVSPSPDSGFHDDVDYTDDDEAHHSDQDIDHDIEESRSVTDILRSSNTSLYQLAYLDVR